MTRTTIAALALVMGTLMAGSALAASVAVTQCGQVVPKGTTGYLTADLDCSAAPIGPPEAAHPGAAIYLGPGGKLDLRGFTLTGRIYGVVCDDICTNGECPRGTCTIFNGAIKDAVRWGASGQTLKVRDLTVTGCGHYGIYVYNKLVMRDSSANDNGEYGVLAWRATISGSTIAGNDEVGIDGGFLSIKDSTVRPNGDGVDCTPDECGDIAASRKPKLKNTSCDISLVSAEGTGQTTWGVCTLD